MPKNPLCRAAIDTKGLNVDPGGYRPWMARLSSGFCQSVLSRFQLSESSPSMKAFASKDGLETSASTPPVSGFKATTAPRRLPKSRSASFCMRMSSDSFSVEPVLGGCEPTTRTMSPLEFLTTSSKPGKPCSCGS